MYEANLKIDQLKWLIIRVHEAIKSGKYEFELYMRSKMKPLGLKENEKVENVPLFLKILTPSLFQEVKRMKNT